MQILKHSQDFLPEMGFVHCLCCKNMKNNIRNNTNSHKYHDVLVTVCQKPVSYFVTMR